MAAFARDEARELRLRRQRGDRDLRTAVDATRRRGASWTEIGEVVRLSSVDVERRFGPRGRRG
jgi:hypothetical protein